MDFSDHEPPPIPRDPTRLTLGEEWTEGNFETGKWGPTNTPGIDATFECGRSDSGSSIRVFPLRYERQGRRETIHGITSDTRAEEHSDKVSQLPEIPAMTAFGVHLTYSPIGGPDLTYYTVAADAGDALAVACWLSQYTTDDSMFEELVYTHTKGQIPVTIVIINQMMMIALMQHSQNNRNGVCSRGKRPKSPRRHSISLRPLA